MDAALAQPVPTQPVPTQPVPTQPVLLDPLLTQPLLSPTTSTPIPDRVLVGFLALAFIIVFGGILRHRYIQRVGGPDRTDVETIGCTQCGYQNRLHHEHCQYCRRSLADHHPITSR